MNKGCPLFHAQFQQLIFLEAISTHSNKVNNVNMMYMRERERERERE